MSSVSSGEEEGAGDATLRRDLRAMVADGVAFSAMVGLGETFVPAFALACGMSASAAALVATLPLLAGALFQLVTPLGVERAGSYRRWVVGCARLQAACFLPLIATAWAPAAAPVAISAATALYWGFGMATTPAWNAWVGGLLPAQRMAHFFAHRARVSHAALLVSFLAGGAVLELGARSGSGLWPFALLFAGACVARIASSAFLASQSEQLGSSHRLPRPAIRVTLRRLHGAEAGRLLAYLLACQVAVHLAAPFFTPYMLESLSLSYASFTALIGAALAARIAVLPVLGRLAARRGTRSLLWIGAVGVVPLPPLWLVSDQLAVLLALQLAAGVAWAALELATLLGFFEQIDSGDRTLVLTAFNLANALALGVGSLLASGLFEAFGGGRMAYALLFATSAAARAASLLLLRGQRGAGPPAAPVELRTLAVRPSVGALQRPVLPTLTPPASGDEQ